MRLPRWFPASLAVAREVIGNVVQHGGVLAGNFAYLALLSIFPFFIVAAALGGIFGRSDYGSDAVQAFLAALPPSVGAAMSAPVEAAMVARSGGLLWLAVIVGLWTTGSLVEAIRMIIRRAYNTTGERPFWHYRLGSMAMIVLTVIASMLALSTQVMLVGASQIITIGINFPGQAMAIVAFGQLLTLTVLFAMLYLLFRLLTPVDCRRAGFPTWPGPLFISLWWMVSLGLMPAFLRNFANYDLTYGSLAGVMISLIFFFLIGVAMVIGAELNAALARNQGGAKAPAA
ncbi:YihY/virulence factor BrkB family protein [Blastomonas sp.]|uniref:YihY/virulence factor BrkB family protein n=1 Tax=Blastomonas sp. TaxID=1909299 RepID=UPI0035933B46